MFHGRGQTRSDWLIKDVRGFLFLPPILPQKQLAVVGLMGHWHLHMNVRSSRNGTGNFYLVGRARCPQRAVVTTPSDARTFPA